MTRGSSNGKAGILVTREPAAMIACSNSITSSVASILIGIIGLEMATVYEALGSEITVVERSDQLIAAADKDIVNPLFKRIKKQYANIFLSAEVTSSNGKAGILVTREPAAMIACSNSITLSVASILICVLETNLP
jgi:pyruvate/2-oxoglutarate dehydrogenase complex dihydrolipoamide dehydrogenase (E3) component